MEAAANSKSVRTKRSGLFTASKETAKSQFFPNDFRLRFIFRSFKALLNLTKINNKTGKSCLIMLCEEACVHFPNNKNF